MWDRWTVDYIDSIMQFIADYWKAAEPPKGVWSVNRVHAAARSCVLLLSIVCTMTSCTQMTSCTHYVHLNYYCIHFHLISLTEFLILLDKKIFFFPNAHTHTHTHTPTHTLTLAHTHSYTH